MWMRAWKTWPILPAWASSIARTTEGFQAIGQFTISRVRWRRDAASIRRAPSAVAAIGFSTNACSPRAAAASTIGTPPAFESQTRTASASTWSKRSRGFSNSAVTPNPRRSFSRSGRFGSAPPTIDTPGSAANWGSSFHAWSWMRPATSSRKGFMRPILGVAPRFCENSRSRRPEPEAPAVDLDPVGGERPLGGPGHDRAVGSELGSVAGAIEPVRGGGVVDFGAPVGADDRRGPQSDRAAPDEHQVRRARKPNFDLVSRILQQVAEGDPSVGLGFHQR